MEKDVFISFTTPDQTIAHKIVDFLEARGISCFIADRDIEKGASYASSLTRGIIDCKTALLVASKNINLSEHVLNELEIMVNKRKFILPFFIEDFEMNDDFTYYLSRMQRIIAYPGNPESFFGKIVDALTPHLPKKEVKENTNAQSDSIIEKTQKVFDYLPERGIMINPEDHQRNVSFRTDTFTNMFGGIFDEVVKLSSEQKAREIFHASGYNCGQSFAQRLNSQWDLQTQSPSLYEEKLRKWCEFDSDVGWGKFEIEVHIDKETGDFSGKLKINESFIVDKKNKRYVCEFVRGYCEGVIETLLDVEVILKCSSCPMVNRFQSACCFDIIIND
ncbi:MAG: toll/interleukin-1 receptor domain-containing protein [Clostridia bacterium]|nr:toll/interleukin-1 receptor domain-containing protein [Clostridia bacterium]